MLNHNHHHIHFAEELVKVKNLVLHKDSVGEEGIEGHERKGQEAPLVIMQIVFGKYHTRMCQTNTHLITIGELPAPAEAEVKGQRIQHAVEEQMIPVTPLRLRKVRCLEEIIPHQVTKKEFEDHF